MRLPALVGRLNHKFANGSMLSGRSFVAEKRTNNDSEWAWGVGLGGKYQITLIHYLKPIITMLRVMDVSCYGVTVAMQ